MAQDTHAGAVRVDSGRPLRLLPPRLIGLLLVAATGAHLLLRIRFHPLSIPLGIALIVLGLVLNIWSDALFREDRTPVRPGERAERLVIRGPFKLTRNPMYLGMVTALLGIALLAGSWPFRVPPVAFFLAASLFYIPFEEAQLQRLFPIDYGQYTKQVRRWL